MKKKIVLGLIAATMLSSMPLNANAVGSASVNFKSNNIVEVGDTIKVYMSIEDIENAYTGIVGVGGRLIYDNEKLEFVEAKLIDAPYNFRFNPKANKLSGIDYNMEQTINKDTTIYEFTFKALEKGNTNITLEEAELSIIPRKGQEKESILNANVNGKTIEVIEKTVEEVKPIIEKNNEKVVKTEVKEETTNKEKLEKVNVVVHELLKKLSNLF